MWKRRGTATWVASATNSTAARWLATISPKVTQARSRSSSSTVLSAWISPMRRTISSCSSCSGLPIRLHWTASGSSMKRAEWKVRMVVWWATPGATTLRPPDQPAMKCGSTSPVAMRSSASTKRRSMRIGVPRVSVRPRSACAASSRAKWFSTRTFASTQSSPISSASSAPSLGRCRPVATSTVIAWRGMPPAIIVSIIGRRNSRLGTGRVMSQTRMQALRRPRTRSRSAAPPSGRSNAAAIAAAGSSSLASRRLRITVAPSAASTRRCPRPNERLTCCMAPMLCRCPALSSASWHARHRARPPGPRRRV